MSMHSKGNNHPTPSQILAAFRDHGVDIRTYKGWDSRGGEWGQPYGGGLDGIVLHHTSTASATGSKGCPTLYWCAETYDWSIANVIIGRGPGDTYFLSGRPSYHSGDGGPFPDIGIHQAANVGHHQLFGVEIDDAGRGMTLTDYQIEQAARISAALWDLCGWPNEKRIITHGAWTDGSYGVNPKGPSPYLARKNDTLCKEWGDWPGPDKVQMYNPVFWRKEAEKYRAKDALWDGTVPRRTAIMRAIEKDGANKATWRLACRLYDLGVGEKPARRGQQTYPAKAVAEMQAKWGWKPTGVYSNKTEKRIWNKAK